MATAKTSPRAARARPDKTRTSKPRASTRRIGAEDSSTRAALIDAAMKLILEEGYAAVTSRRVAARAGLKPQLVHYYFRTMDELFLALLQQGVAHNQKLLERVLESPQPLRALWDFNAKETRMVVEFAALANHRPAIRAALAANAAQQRQKQVEVLTGVIERYGIDTKAYPPSTVIVLITALSRILAMEETVMGLTIGHTEMRALVERVFSQYEGKKAT